MAVDTMKVMIPDRENAPFLLAEAARPVPDHGATPIDRDMPVNEQVRRFTDGCGFDMVHDTLGGAVLDVSFAAGRRFGHVVSALG